MNRWRRASLGRSGRGRRNGTVSAGPGGRGAADAPGRAVVVVEEYDDLILLRSSSDSSLGPDDAAELASSLATDETGRRVSTVLVGAGGVGSELWKRLGVVLDSLRDRGTTTVRLALPGAGSERADRPAMAQEIADAWEIEVIAPEAGVMIVPGGSLFVLGEHAPDRGWRSFRPGAEPTPLGRRSPAPPWQPALARLPEHTSGGCVVEQIPAGVRVRPARAPRARSGDLCYAVPVDAHHLTVLVGAPEPSGGADVGSEDLATLLATLPPTTRSAIRLAPYGPLDLLPVAQDTADFLGTEVEVLTGLPLLVGAADAPVVRSVLVDGDARPSWAPFIEALACRPSDAAGVWTVPAPTLLRWHPPMSGTGALEPGVVHLSERWQVSVTRAGLRVGPRGETPPLPGRPASPGQMAIEVNLPESADDALFADLSRLLSELDVDIRPLVTLYPLQPPHRSDDGGFRLLRLAIEHGVPVVEPSQPLVTPLPAPARPDTRTVSASHHERLPAQAVAAPSEPRPAARKAPQERAVSSAPTSDGSGYAQRSVNPPAAVNPPASAEERPTWTASVPVKASVSRPAATGGTKPLPPMLGRIPLTPVKEASPAPSDTPASPGSAGTAVERSLTPEPPVTPAAPTPPAAAPPSEAPPGPVTPPKGPATPPGDPVTPPAAAGRSRPRVAVPTVRRSTEAERSEFRSLVQPVWERHSAAVSRAMTRMPALRGSQVDAARTDLVAVHLYLSVRHDEPDDREPVRVPSDGADDPYTACLVSGLCRLPSYRGVAARGGLPADGGLERLVPGRLLREPGPVSALPIGAAAGLSAATGGYVIWSSTGRRVRPLLGTGPGAASDEVVFPPGVGFRVLEVRTEGAAPIVLLSEVLGSGPAIDDRPGGLDDADRATLERLDEALGRQVPSATGTSPGTWPERCAHPLGEPTR